MGTVVLACGGAVGAAVPRLAGHPALHEVPATPRKADVDPLLSEADRLVVLGTDADLAAVVLRVLRASRLAELPVGLVPVRPADSMLAGLLGLPRDPVAVADLALDAPASAVPLIRDDTGNVLVGRGVLRDIDGIAYCDDQLALRGRARLVEVFPDFSGGPGLVAHFVHSRPLRRRKTLLGRAFQLGCEPTIVLRDGVAHPRPVRQWTWYRHTEDLRLARPAKT